MSMITLSSLISQQRCLRNMGGTFNLYSNTKSRGTQLGSHFKRISVRYCFGSVPENLQMIDNITSSAPAPIESSRMSRNIRLISTSAVYPIPPQYCRHESVSSRASRPALSFAIDASLVTSWPLRYRPGECVCVCVCVCGGRGVKVVN